MISQPGAAAGEGINLQETYIIFIIIRKLYHLENFLLLSMNRRQQKPKHLYSMLTNYYTRSTKTVIRFLTWQTPNSEKPPRCAKIGNMF